MPGNEGFDWIAAGIDYPMYVVTTAGDGKRSGCLVGFTTHCSIDPPRFLVCLSKANRTFRVAEGAAILCVHLLHEDDQATAELFGAETGDEIDKFARCAWSAGPGGAPVLDGALAWFAARVLDRVDLGDHVGYVVEPLPGEGAGGGGAGGFYSFRQGRRMEPGHPA